MRYVMPAALNVNGHLLALTTLLLQVVVWISLPKPVVLQPDLMMTPEYGALTGVPVGTG